LEDERETGVKPDFKWDQKQREENREEIEEIVLEDERETGAKPDFQIRFDRIELSR